MNAYWRSSSTLPAWASRRCCTSVGRTGHDAAANAGANAPSANAAPAAARTRVEDLGTKDEPIMLTSCVVDDDGSPGEARERERPPGAGTTLDPPRSRRIVNWDDGSARGRRLVRRLVRPPFPPRGE